MGTIESDVSLLQSLKLLDYSLLFAVETLSPGCERPSNLGRHRYYSTCGRYVYHISIIDYLCSFNFAKRFESFYKTVIKGAPAAKVSAVHPQMYGDRFIDFMRKQVIVNEDQEQLLVLND